MHTNWRDKVLALKTQWIEDMRAQLTAREADVFAACTRFGITDKNRDAVLDLLDRTMVERDRKTLGITAAPVKPGKSGCNDFQMRSGEFCGNCGFHIDEHSF